MKAITFALVLSGLASGHAEAAKPRGPSFDATVEDLPVPPIPPKEGSSFGAAPVPNDYSNPDAPISTNGAKLAPNLFRPRDYNLGSGYVNGSTVQGEQRRRAPPTPGVNLSVPIN